MKSSTICLLAAAAVCLMLFALGCQSEPQEPERPAPIKPIEPEKVQPEKPEPEKVEPEKPEPEKVEPEKPEPEKVEPEKPEPEKPEPEKPEPEKPVKPVAEAPKVALALKFKPDDTVNYKLITEADKSVLWEGPAGSTPKGFKGGHTRNRIEVAFARTIKSVEENGNAVAEVTFKAIKYFATVKDSVVTDFDSVRDANKPSPFNKLLGKSYTVRLTPYGQVAGVVDAADARKAVTGATAVDKRAASLVSAELITDRHTIRGMPAAEKSKVPEGGKWSHTEDFDFQMMGKKAYEKIYTLKQTRNAEGRPVALAEMAAVPSTAGAQQLHQQQAGGFFSKMFDNQESFTGRLEVDLEAGCVLEYLEDLKSEWLAVDPSATEADKEPAALRMTATRLYHLKKVK